MSKMFSFKKGTDVELNIQSLAFGGMGIAYLNDMVTFVKNAIPGQKVNARITKKRSSYLEARCLNVISESPFYTDAKCKHFYDCGGCTFQNLEYSKQVHAKELQVKDIFNRIGGFNEINCAPIVACDKIFHYRNKMEFTFSNREYIPENEKNREPKKSVLGLHAPGRWDKVLDISTCYIQSKIANEILCIIKEYSNHFEAYDLKLHTGYLRNVVIRIGQNTNELMVNFITSREDSNVLKPLIKILIQKFPNISSIVNNITSRKSGTTYGEKQIILYGKEYFLDSLGDYEFMISADSFFQTNTQQAKKLYDIILEESNLTGDEIVYDLFCGTGSIAIYISKFAKMVYGFELLMPAIQNAMQNAIRNKVDNVSFFVGDLQNLFQENQEAKALQLPDVIIVDPPRAGLHIKTINAIIEKSPCRIVYVSCNPSTQARDVKIFCENGYKLIKLRPVDMFPHTPHIENISTLVKDR